MIEFLENDDGVHPMFGEFTICGLAFDVSAVDEDATLSPTRKRLVTCPQCAAIVRFCRDRALRVSSAT